MLVFQMHRKGKDRALLLAALCTIGFLVSADAETLEFDGQVEAIHQADVYSRVEGIVAEVLVSQGDFVDAGTVLARLQQDVPSLKVAVSEARLARANALLEQAHGRLARIQRLTTSGTASDVALTEAKTDLVLAEAAQRAESAELSLARTALDDTVIRAPIAGFVEDPRVRVGAVLEFSSGDPPIFQIVNLDPVRIVYEVPYEIRLRQMKETGASTADEFLQSVRLQVMTTDGELLARGLTPTATAVWVEPDTGTIRVWATLENSAGVLRPGMRVRVLSEVIKSGSATQ